MKYIVKAFKDAKIPQKQVISDLGVPQSYASALMNGKKEVGKEIAKKLSDLYGFDQSLILLDGSSTSIKNSSNDLGSIEYPTLNSPNQFIDLKDGKILMIIAKVEEPAYAGYLSGYSDPEYIENLPMHSIIVEKRHRGTYRAFEIVGDSMDDGTKESIPDGSVATGREIIQSYWSTKFHTHRFKDYIIVSHTEGIIAKRITHQDVVAGLITCHSLNPNKDEYPDRIIDLREVKQIFNIVNVSIAR